MIFILDVLLFVILDHAHLIIIFLAQGKVLTQKLHGRHHGLVGCYKSSVTSLMTDVWRFTLSYQTSCNM